MVAAATLACLVRPGLALMGDRRFPADVAISSDDIAWFRACRSLWVDSESGAPALFGPGLSPTTIGTVSDADYAAYEAKMEPILCAFFLHASFEPGRYAFASPLAGRTEIDVTAEDVTLLRSTSWRTFAIDGKRPYGDYVNYTIDMARVLNVPVRQNAQGYAEIAPDEETRLEALHRKSQFVLQAYLEQAKLAPGDWFIPIDGWEALILPRCRPVRPAAVAAYRLATERIEARAATEDGVKLVVPRLQAAAALFGSE